MGFYINPELRQTVGRDTLCVSCALWECLVIFVSSLDKTADSLHKAESEY